jgi:hypothetical protein
LKHSFPTRRSSDLDVTITPDLAGIDRVVEGRRS